MLPYVDMLLVVEGLKDKQSNDKDIMAGFSIIEIVRILFRTKSKLFAKTIPAMKKYMYVPVLRERRDK